MCNCIDDVNRNLKEICGDDANLVTVLRTVERDGNSFIEEQLVIPFEYYKNQKNGMNSMKPIKAYVFGSFCPFCGKEIIN